MWNFARLKAATVVCKRSCGVGRVTHQRDNDNHDDDETDDGDDLEELASIWHSPRDSVVPPASQQVP